MILTDSTVFEEAPAFLESGEFNLELRNTMPLAMTYVLGIPCNHYSHLWRTMQCLE